MCTDNAQVIKSLMKVIDLVIYYPFCVLADNVHYLELVMRISGVKRLSLPSPNPADSPLVRCDTAKLAQKVR